MNQQTKREEDGVEFYPKLFRPLSIEESVENGNDKLEFIIYKDRIVNRDFEERKYEQLEKHICEMAPILPGQKFHKTFEIPAFQKLKGTTDTSN